jgi:hypothetical protein
MATQTLKTKRSLRQVRKSRPSAPASEPQRANEYAWIDCVAVMEEMMRFLLRRAIKASDEKVAKRLAKDANRAFKGLARYHPLYNRLWRKGFDMHDLKQASVVGGARGRRSDRWHFGDLKRFIP